MYVVRKQYQDSPFIIESANIFPLKAMKEQKYVKVTNPLL